MWSSNRNGLRAHQRHQNPLVWYLMISTNRRTLLDKRDLHSTDRFAQVSKQRDMTHEMKKGGWRKTWRKLGTHLSWGIWRAKISLSSYSNFIEVIKTHSSIVLCINTQALLTLKGAEHKMFSLMSCTAMTLWWQVKMWTSINHYKFTRGCLWQKFLRAV